MVPSTAHALSRQTVRLRPACSQVHLVEGTARDRRSHALLPAAWWRLRRQARSSADPEVVWLLKRRLGISTSERFSGAVLPDDQGTRLQQRTISAALLPLSA